MLPLLNRSDVEEVFDLKVHMVASVIAMGVSTFHNKSEMDKALFVLCAQDLFPSKFFHEQVRTMGFADLMFHSCRYTLSCLFSTKPL